jgi:hypothetical protein
METWRWWCVVVAVVLAVGCNPQTPAPAKAVAAAPGETPAPEIEIPEESRSCVECHGERSPGLVADWKLSAHAVREVDCATCHGTGHQNADDVAAVKTITAESCGECHEEKLEQFSRGKHALAWASMKAMPTIHWKPTELTGGMEGCGGCHKIGLKTGAEVEELKRIGSGYGLASCDSCHTRHTFSVKEAREPEACATCHMGYDQPQWEMYMTSKHGVRHSLKRHGVLPEDSAAPTCQTCHMPEGTHEVQTAWGYMGLRMHGPLRYPDEDAGWWEDRVTILKALGALDPDGEPTERMKAFEKTKFLRTDADEFDRLRARMVATCSECHSESFAKTELGKGDRMIRKADGLMASAIRIVAALYADGVLKKPADYEYDYPDLLTYQDAPSLIETRLFRMHLQHRMSAFKGAFHNNPNYALWHGWNELESDLTAITEMARELRERHEAKNK